VCFAQTVIRLAADVGCWTKMFKYYQLPSCKIILTVEKCVPNVAKTKENKET